MILQTLGAAVLAAVLVLLAEHLVLRSRDRAGRREERRAFVRQLHPATVGLVVDVDSFVIDLRANAVAGPVSAQGTEIVDRILRERWDVAGDIQDSVFLGLLAREWNGRAT